MPMILQSRLKKNRTTCLADNKTLSYRLPCSSPGSLCSDSPVLWPCPVAGAGFRQQGAWTRLSGAPCISHDHCGFSYIQLWSQTLSVSRPHWKIQAAHTVVGLLSTGRARAWGESCLHHKGAKPISWEGAVQTQP